MRLNLLASVISVILASCNSSSEEQVLRGEGIYIPTEKVYLSEAGHFEHPIDSAMVVDGKFEIKFSEKVDPFMVELIYRRNDGSLGTICVPNLLESKVNGNYNSYCFFMLEEGETILRGDSGFSESHSYAFIDEGKENSLFFKTKNRDIGYVNNGTKDKYQKSLKSVNSWVEEYPDSYFLLANIYKHRVHYKRDDLQRVLSKFDDKVQRSGKMKEFRDYLVDRLDAEQTKPPLSLTNIDGIYVQELDRKAPLNMIIFWASWCGPCRKEIPHLKELRQDFRSTDLNIVSVSIDTDEDEWRRATEIENMDWGQFIIPPDSLSTIKARYNFNAIPLVLFTDSEGNEVKRFVGYSEENPKHYSSLIRNFYHKN